MINTKVEATEFVDTKIRQDWQEWVEKYNVPTTLGKAEIIKETFVNGHKAWEYYIEGLPMSRDGRKRWLLDTGETIDTTLKEDENTIEKAFKKVFGKNLA